MSGVELLDSAAIVSSQGETSVELTTTKHAACCVGTYAFTIMSIEAVQAQMNTVMCCRRVEALMQKTPVHLLHLEVCNIACHDLVLFTFALSHRAKALALT